MVQNDPWLQQQGVFEGRRRGGGGEEVWEGGNGPANRPADGGVESVLGEA